MGKFITKTSKNGKFYFILKAGNGEPILTSEMYEDASGRDKGIQSVRANAVQDARYERMISFDGKFYFNLKAGNYQVIGVSEMYESAFGRDKGIESVKKNAPDAPVEADLVEL